MNDQTSDNLLLSEPSGPPLNWAGNSRFADNCTQSTLAAKGRAVNCTDERLRELIEAATAPNTRRAYESDLRHFLAWGGKIPASEQMVARYLADHLPKMAMSTLRRRLVAIGQAHLAQGHQNPCRTELVRLVFRGGQRTYGCSQRRVAALTKEQLAAVTSLLGNSVRDLRDRALLLIGFAGAFRRSELCAVDCKSIAWAGQGIVVSIPKSKTDQEREGRAVAIPRGSSSFCPVTALSAWLEVANITNGPIFRPIDRSGRIGSCALSGEAVALIFKRRVKGAGLDPFKYSGHSLRAGFVTSAIQAGIPACRIRAQTGHASEGMLGRYYRNVELAGGASEMEKIQP